VCTTSGKHELASWNDRLLPLRPADSAEVADALAYALLYDAMARIAADYLIRHLARSGFVMMRAPPGAAPTTATMLSSRC